MIIGETLTRKIKTCCRHSSRVCIAFLIMLECILLIVVAVIQCTDGEKVVYALDLLGTGV